MFIQSKLCLIGALTLLAARISFGQNPPGTGQDGDPGPPLFLTSPIASDVAPPGLTKGHFRFENGVVVPAPLAHDLGSASFRRAPHAGETQLAGSGFTVISPNNSYEGETGATSKAGLIVGGSNHIYPGACNAAAPPGAVGDCAPLAYASLDGGATWTHTALPRDWNGTSFGIGFDPAVDVDKNGTFYYSYGVAPLSGNYPNGIVVVKSSDGLTWTQLPPVTFNSSKYFDDKYWIAVDRSNSAYANRIYVTWDRNTSINQILEVAYSTNGGASWTNPIKVNDGTSKFERVIGAYPAVDHNTGTVYVSWHDYAQNKIFVDKSMNGGATWGTDRIAATTHTGFGQDIGCVGGRSQGPAHHLKVGPSGTLYLVYADAVAGRGYDILFTKSTNGGMSWSTPFTLNDDSGNADQFHPTLSVESNGSGGDLVTVTFYDRRDDPGNCLAQVYATESSDNGVTWATNNVKITTGASNFDGNPNGPGDYSSSTPSNLGRFPFFCVHPAGSGTGAFDVATVKLSSSPPPPPTTDLAVTAVSVPASVVVNTQTPVTVTVHNLGTTTGPFNVSLSDNLSSTIPNTPQAVSVAAGASLDVNFNWTPLVTGLHTLTGANTTPDSNAANDTLTADSNVTSGTSGPPPTVSGISPNVIQAGSSVGVTITGTGFAAGASVGFANGTGPAPSAFGVSVDSATTITATISASQGGPKGNRVWDVVVTNPDGQSGSLTNGFTVQK